MPETYTGSHIETYNRLTPERVEEMDVVAYGDMVYPLTEDELYSTGVEQFVQGSGTESADVFPSQEQKNREVSSIFKYFDIDNEVAFAQKQLERGGTPDTVRMLLSNEVICFLEEFAGKVDTAKISYTWKDGQLYAPGMSESALQSWTRWAEQTNGEREWADAFGFEKIQTAFKNGEGNIAFQLSPPSIGAEGFGTYGFCNVYINEGDSTSVYLLKYNNENAALTESNRMQKSLNPDHIESTNPADFLTEPVVFTTSGNKSEVTLKLEELGFGPDFNLEEASEFTRTVRTELKTWIEMFNSAILSMTTAQTHDEYRALHEQAKLLLAACYNKARDIKNYQDGKESRYTGREGTAKARTDADQDIIELRRYANVEEAVVVGGGSCPAGGSNGVTQSMEEILMETGGALSYSTINTIFDERAKTKDKLACTCPFCNRKVEAKIDRQAKTITCPNPECKKSAPYQC